MKTYEKPIAVKVDDMSEGVYAASGGPENQGCYTSTARIHQVPETGRGDYRIQVDAVHAANHTCEYDQRLVISFNQPVQYVNGGSGIISGDGTTTLTIQLKYHQNPNDNIGLGDLKVTSDAGLAITNVKVLCKANGDY